MKNFKLILVSFAIIAIAAGCSGGGSSGGAPAVSKVTINSGNADAVAKGGMSSSQGMAKTGSTGATNAAKNATDASAAPGQSAMQLALAQFKRVQGLNITPAPASVVGTVSGFSPQIIMCTTSGSFTFDLVDTNNNTQFDIGDAISLTYSNCVEPNPAKSGATFTTNGAMTLTINASSGSGTAQDPLVASVTMGFTNFTNVDTAPTTPETVTISGALTLAITDNGTTLTATMTGTSFSMASTSDGTFTMNGSVVFSENITTLAYSFTVNMTTNSVALGGAIDITTTTPFTGTGTGNPTAGVMKISGANNSYITITANSDNTVTIVTYDGTQFLPAKTVGWDKV